MNIDNYLSLLLLESYNKNPLKKEEANKLEENRVKPKKRGRPKKYRRIIIKHDGTIYEE